MDKPAFVIYTKCTVWERRDVPAGTVTLDELKELIRDNDYYDISSAPETDYETIEEMLPEENGGCSTVEVQELKEPGVILYEDALPRKEKELSIKDLDDIKIKKLLDELGVDYVLNHFDLIKNDETL